jgi:hypothetical protein
MSHLNHCLIKQSSRQRFSLFFFLCCFIFCLATNCRAQEISVKHKAFVGIKAGISRSSIKGTEVNLIRSGGDDIKPVMGIVFGVLFKYGFTEDLYGKLEAFHIVKGARYVGSTFYEHQNKVVTYLEFPLLIGYNLINVRGLKLGIEAGPAFHYAIGPYKYDPNNYINSASIRTPKTMLSPVAGIDLSFYNKVMNYFIGARYDLDSKKFFYREYAGTHYYMQHKGTVSVSAGILLKLSKG